MVARRRASEQVVRQPEVAQVLGDEAVVVVGHVARTLTGPIGGHEDRRTVLVGSAHHEHSLARHPLIAAEHVGRRRNRRRDRCDVGHWRTAKRPR